MYQTELVHGSYPQAQGPGSHTAVLNNVCTEQRVVVKTFQRIENGIRHASHVVEFQIFEEVVPVEEKLALFPPRRRNKELDQNKELGHDGLACLHYWH